jgi:hypothetical protein
MYYAIWVIDKKTAGHIKADTTRNRPRAIMLARDFDAQGDRDARVVKVGDDGSREIVYEHGAPVG